MVSPDWVSNIGLELGLFGLFGCGLVFHWVWFGYKIWFIRLWFGLKIWFRTGFDFHLVYLGWVYLNLV